MSIKLLNYPINHVDIFSMKDGQLAIIIDWPVLKTDYIGKIVQRYNNDLVILGEDYFVNDFFKLGENYEIYKRLVRILTPGEILIVD